MLDNILSQPQKRHLFKYEDTVECTEPYFLISGEVPILNDYYAIFEIRRKDCFLQGWLHFFVGTGGGIAGVIKANENGLQFPTKAMYRD